MDVKVRRENAYGYEVDPRKVWEQICVEPFVGIGWYPGVKECIAPCSILYTFYRMQKKLAMTSAVAGLW